MDKMDKLEIAYALDEIDACKETRKNTKDKKIKAKCNTRILKWKEVLKELGHTKRV